MYWSFSPSPHTMSHVCTDNLLKDGAITGVCLISRNASCLYSVGKLQQISQVHDHCKM